MSEIQNVNVSTVNATGADAAQVNATATKASLFETLRDLGTSWAETAIGFGKNTLESFALTLERTAEKLGTLQEKLKKGDVAAIASR